MKRSNQQQQQLSAQKTRVSPTTVPVDPLAAARSSPKYESEMKEIEALKLKVLEAQRAAEEAQRTAQEMIRQAMEAKEEVPPLTAPPPPAPSTPKTSTPSSPSRHKIIKGPMTGEEKVRGANNCARNAAA